MEFPVGFLIRFRNAFHVLDDIEQFQEIHIDRRNVTDQAEYRLIRALGHVHRNPLSFQPDHQLLSLFIRRLWL